MKEKLEVIQNKLDLIQHPYANDGANKQLLEQVKALLDSLIAELESPELVERVDAALAENLDKYMLSSLGIKEIRVKCAQAAINCIVTATRDRE